MGGMSPLFASWIIFAIKTSCFSAGISSHCDRSIFLRASTMSLSISHDPGATRAYIGHRVSLEWQSAHFVTSTDFASAGILAPCSSVPGPFEGSTRGFPKGWTYPSPATAATVSTATIHVRFIHFPPTSNRLQPDDYVRERP